MGCPHRCACRMSSVLWLLHPPRLHARCAQSYRCWHAMMHRFRDLVGLELGLHESMVKHVASKCGESLCCRQTLMSRLSRGEACEVRL